MKPKEKIKTLAQAEKLVGQEKDYILNGLTFKVKILEAKIHGPFLMYKITPINGKGEDWVQTFTKITKRQ